MTVKLFPAASFVLLAGWMITSAAQPAMADNKDVGNTTSNSTKTSSSEQHPYLGIAIEPLHPSMASHLPDVLIDGQGVLVAATNADSPAAKAGIETSDILIRYGDQKLFSAEQLAKLVMADKSGHEVAIELVRGGKLKTVHVTLESRPADHVAQHPPQHWWNEFSWPWFHHHRHMMNPNHHMMKPSTGDQANSKNWDRFDSMTLKHLDKDRFQAEIKYLDDQGKLQQHVFKGTRDEIEQAVKSEKNLPASEREHLLNAIEHPQHAWFVPEFRIDRDGDVNFTWPSYQSEF